MWEWSYCRRVVFKSNCEVENNSFLKYVHWKHYEVHDMPRKQLKIATRSNEEKILVGRNSSNALYG